MTELFVFLFHRDEDKLSEGLDAFVVVALEDVSGDGFRVV